MFGDPRIYLSKKQPYQIVSDRIAENGKRVIVGDSEKNELLAVKIDNAAAYHFIRIKGLSSLSENDIFYNNKVQTLDLGTDKYLLFLHKGGSFQIELSPSIPFGWVLTDALSDALDYAWIALWVNVYADGNPSIYVVSIPIFTFLLLFKIFKHKKSFHQYQKHLCRCFFSRSFSIGLFLTPRG